MNSFLVWLLAAAVLACGCDKKAGEGAGDASAAKSGSTASGVKECDDYFAALASCKGMPEESKKLMEQNADAIRSSLAGVSDEETKRRTAESCTQAAEALKHACE